MTRGLSVALGWRLPFWKRNSPGTLGGITYFLLPLLFFLPLEDAPLFETRWRGIAILVWLFAAALALGIRSGRTLRDEDSIWALQQGLSLGEAAVEDWILDMGLLSIAAFWWGTIGALVGWTAGYPLASHWLALVALGLATAALTHSFTLFLSACGIRRPSDATAFAAFLSLTMPVLLIKGPPWAQLLSAWIIPPFREAVALHGAIRIGNLKGEILALSHLGLFVIIFLGAGVWRMSKWRPRA